MKAMGYKKFCGKFTNGDFGKLSKRGEELNVLKELYQNKTSSSSVEQGRKARQVV